jgi:hypothetical protein
VNPDDADIGIEDDSIPDLPIARDDRAAVSEAVVVDPADLIPKDRLTTMPARHAVRSWL